MSIASQIEAAINEICDKYCKFPEKYAEKYGGDDEKREALFDEVCINCPLINL